MTPSQWDRFYAGLGTTGEISEKLRECSQPKQNWTNDPEQYRIIGSDPVEEDEDEGKHAEDMDKEQEGQEYEE